MFALVHLLCLGMPAAGTAASGPAVFAAARPNILWITSEDNGPYLGCYGDALAHTPNLDQLAKEGVRYRNAFANAPVCSAARSTLLMGMHASTLGLQHHRSRVRVPAEFLAGPEYLRQAGYYCSNNSKTDYNWDRDNRAPWDACGPQAHHRNRKPGQPFFAVFNLTASHEGQLQDRIVLPRREQGLLPAKTRIAPESMGLPPYHPDTPAIREDWARYYDNVTLMDAQVGQRLQELQDQGLAGNTIVCYFSDHGGALPRAKRNLHDSGTRVPLIIRFPAKWANLAPGKPGEWIGQPVSFVDFPATLCSLAGVPIPRHFQGTAFLGLQADSSRDYAFLFRGRMDERYDTARAIRDRRYRYIRNYSPHRPWGQHYSYPFEVLPSMTAWYDAWRAGRCNPVQSRYWQPKPSEELYDLEADPHEVNNLAGVPQHHALLQRMRQTLSAEMLRTRDTAFIPEAMFDRLAGRQTLYDYAQSDDYPIERLLPLANLATARDPDALPRLMTALDDPHPLVRYWAAVGCRILREQAQPASTKLQARLEDDWFVIRVAAAEALAWLSEPQAALRALQPILTSPNEYESLSALNALDFMRQAGQVPAQQAVDVLGEFTFPEPAARIARHIRNGAP